MKRSKIFLVFIMLLIAACTPNPASLEPAPATPEPASATATSAPTPTFAPIKIPGELYVDPDVDLGAISPYIFGSNSGPAYVVPFAMLPTVLESGIEAYRFPGGAWGDRNKIQTYHLDQFMSFIEQTGAMPTVSVNLRDGTPEQAAELVRYANLEKGYNITYWSIGNEPNLYEAELGETYDTTRYNQAWRATAQAMKAVDPNIRLMGPELGQWGTGLETTQKDSAGNDWMSEFLKANGDLVDVVTVHRYPFWSGSGRTTTIADLRQNTNEWPQMITYLRGLIQDLTGRDLPIAFTEVNSDPSGVFQGEATPDSDYNAIWFADVLGRAIQGDVFMLNHWVIAQNSTGHGLFKGSEIRPTFHIFTMYKPFGEAQVYAASGVQDVNVYAARRADGALTVMVVNLSDSQQNIPLRVQGAAPQAAEVWLFDASHNAENLGQQPLPADGGLTLPPQSVSLFVISD